MLKPLFTGMPEIWHVIVLILVAIATGVIFAIIYAKLKQKDGFHKDVVISYALFPVIAAGLILAIDAIALQFEGSEITTRAARIAIAVAGVFIVLRFRSEQRNFEDITYLFALTGVGFLLGMGYIVFAAIFYAVVVAIVIVLYLIGFPKDDPRYLTLRITIPEDLAFEEAFDDIFEKYTEMHKLEKIKSAEMGTLLTIDYQIKLKKDASKKDFQDEIRTRNGNLNITMVMRTAANQSLK